MALTRTDVLMAAVVLRALGYAVDPARDAPDATVRPAVVTALRTFQAAANREQSKALVVDGILGGDSLNALAWFAVQPYAAGRLSYAGLTAEQGRAVSQAIAARRNNPWGLGAPGAPGAPGGTNPPNTPRPTPRPTSTPTPARTSNPTQQASMFGSGASALLVLGVLGVAGLAGAKLFGGVEKRRVEEGASGRRELPSPVRKAATAARKGLDRAARFAERYEGGGVSASPARASRVAPTSDDAPRTNKTSSGGVLSALASLQKRAS